MHIKVCHNREPPGLHSASRNAIDYQYFLIMTHPHLYFCVKYPVFFLQLKLSVLPAYVSTTYRMIIAKPPPGARETLIGEFPSTDNVSFL